MRTQATIRKAFVDAGITPMQSGVWKKYVPTSFMPKGSPAACQILNQVCKLQDKMAISAYLFACGLDDQNPEDWGDVDSLRAETEEKEKEVRKILSCPPLKDFLRGMRTRTRTCEQGRWK